MNVLKTLEFYRDGFVPNQKPGARLTYGPTEELLNDCGNRAREALLNATIQPALVFTCDGYDFYRDEKGYWNVSHRGDPAPKHCAYGSPKPIAELKGVRLSADNMIWLAPAKEG